MLPQTNVATKTAKEILM